MKPFTPGWQAAVRESVLPIAWCWKVTRLDGVAQGFTTHVEDRAFDGLTYSAASGFLSSDIAAGDTLAVDNLEIQGAISSAAITVADLQAGLYDGAALEIFYFNYEKPELGKRTQFVGSIGAVTNGDIGFTASQRGLTQPLSQTRGRIVSPQCDAILGDSRCRVDLSLYRVTGTVSDPIADRAFADAARTEADGWWTGGNLTVLTGASAGFRMEVKRSTSTGVIELVLPLPFGLADGDTYSMTPGCNHLLKAPGPPQTQNGTVYHVFTAAELSTTGLTYPSGYFDRGVLTWTSGANFGLTASISAHTFDGSYGHLVFAAPQANTVQIGDTFNVTADASTALLYNTTYLGDCKVKFNNVVNFRGFPEVPGPDRITQFGGRTGV